MLSCGQQLRKANISMQCVSIMYIYFIMFQVIPFLAKRCVTKKGRGGISLPLPQKYATALQQFETSSSNETILGRKENQRRATSSTRVEESKLHRQVLRRMQQMQDWL